MGRRKQHRAASPTRPAAAKATTLAKATTSAKAVPPPAGAAATSGGRWVEAIGVPALLLVLVWLYLWLRVEPPLRYHESAPVFLFRADFLGDCWSRPGGLLDYAAAGLAQLDYHAILGALAATVLIGLVAAGLGRLLGRAGKHVSWLVWVPGLLLLVLAGRYDSPVLSIGLGILLPIWGLVAWQTWRPNHAGLRGAGFWLYTACVFYVAGPAAAAWFVAYGSLYESVTSNCPAHPDAMRPGASPLPVPQSIDTLSSSDGERAGVRGPDSQTGSWKGRTSRMWTRVVATNRSKVERDSEENSRAGLGVAPETSALETPACGALGEVAPPGGSSRGSAGGLTSALVCGLAVVVVLGGVLVWPEVSFADFVPPWGKGWPMIVCVLLLHAVPLLAIWFSSVRPEAPLVSEMASTSRPGGGGWMPGPGWGWRLAGLAVAAGVLLLTFEGHRKTLIQIDWHAEHGRWEKALEAARRLRVRPDAATRLRIHQALYHSDRLTQDLFAFPQWKGADLLPSMREGPDVCRPLSDTLVELGQVGLAEHYAHEALELEGERPALLWQLARIHVLQDRPRAARVFLNRLRQVPFHRQEAERRLQALDRDPSLAGETDIARIRPLLVNSDYAASGVPAEFLLRQLLRSNGRNRMAFEYLMAHYLLIGQLDALVRDLAALDTFGVWETPRHLEEAALAFLTAKGESRTEIAGRRVSAETVRRHRQFQELLAQNGGRVTGLEMRLAREYGDTFWFYQLFGATFGSLPPRFSTHSR